MTRFPTLAPFIAFALAVTLAPAPAPAQTLATDAAPNFWFAGTRLTFERPQSKNGQLAVASDDSGLGRFLQKLGATLSYQPGQSYVVVTTGDRRTVTFAIGDPHYVVAGVTQTASFAPYAIRGAAYVPFAELARALDVTPVGDGGATVLEPQIASLEVRPLGRITVVTLRGASPLHFKRLTSDGDALLTLAFSGISSTLERNRQIAGAGLQNLAITAGGTPRNPRT
ncbi:MAG: hypothetical protein IAI49_03745, partial [Candidatus Eremiobacteraeota bacterium]|nr:hypothetical protein [Candidatus Eremiobacteraeota bacterium]